jgi:DNA-binding transcriptional LysR family regulator
MRGQIELRHFRYFLAVAETLHFGNAAARLAMAQPPLSQQIKTLENIVGYCLFDRTTRGVRLTAVGQYLLECARKTLERVDQDIEMARRLGKGQEGVLSVGFSGSVMFTRRPFLIERYRRLYPKVELHLQELVTAEQMCALKEGALDLACVSSLAMPNVVYKRSPSTHRTSVDIAIRRDFHSPVAAAFLTIIRQQFSVENEIPTPVRHSPLSPTG